MCNVCVNTIYFCSDNKELLQKLFAKVRRCYESIGMKSVYDLFLIHDYEQGEIDGMIDKRDDISACDSVIRHIENYFYFEAETNSAWEPHMGVLKKLLIEKYADKIRMLYCSEEAGCGVFKTNDIDGIFFNDKFRLSYGHDDEHEVEYFESFQRMVQYIRSYLCSSVSELDDLYSIEQKVIEAHDVDYPNYYCNINRFEYEGSAE